MARPSAASSWRFTGRRRFETWSATEYPSPTNPSQRSLEARNSSRLEKTCSNTFLRLPFFPPSLPSTTRVSIFPRRLEPAARAIFKNNDTHDPHGHTFCFSFAAVECILHPAHGLGFAVLQIMEAAFPRMLKDRLRSNETHRFRKEWIYDAVRWCRAQVRLAVAVVFLSGFDEFLPLVQPLGSIHGGHTVDFPRFSCHSTLRTSCIVRKGKHNIFFVLVPGRSCIITAPDYVWSGVLFFSHARSQSYGALTVSAVHHFLQTLEITGWVRRKGDIKKLV